MISPIHIPLTHSELNAGGTNAIVRAAARIAIVNLALRNTTCLLVKHPKKGWEFPGGAIEPNERAEITVLRELREEAGVTLPPSCGINFAGTVPLIDNHGGCWIDIVFFAIATRHENISTEKSIREFDSEWLTLDSVDNNHTKAIWELVVSHIGSQVP